MIAGIALGAFLKKYWKQILILVVVMYVLWSFYKRGKLKGEAENNKPGFWDWAMSFNEPHEPSPEVDLPNSGSGIPQGWDPTPTVLALYNELDSWFVNDDTILTLLSPLTQDQRASIYNEYNATYEPELGMNLLEHIEAGMSGQDLATALGYFSGIA